MREAKNVLININIRRKSFLQKKCQILQKKNLKKHLTLCQFTIDANTQKKKLKYIP